jgi:hypothetical protein
MNLAAFRLTCLAAATGLFLAACGGSRPEPVPEPGPVVVEPAAPEPEVIEDDVEVHADHDDHDAEGSAGGTAHVHGLADLAVTREENRLLGELISPMANFGLSESDGVYTDVIIAELSGLVELDGGDCTAAVPHPTTDNSGGHTDGVIHFSWTCARPGDVRAIRFAGFEAFPSFETVSAIYITATDQKVAELTPASPELALK